MQFLNTDLPQWMGAEATPETAEWVLVGMPYDGTTSFRPGTRFGPAAIREASWRCLPRGIYLAQFVDKLVNGNLIK